MPRNKFPLEVLTPEGEAFAGEVEMVSTVTGVGVRAPELDDVAVAVDLGEGDLPGG